ncbi:hypothetical protein ScPMuIL_009895 [Solemya velum]
MADVEIRVETDGGNQALPPKRPTIIRPPSVHQSTGDRHGPSVPGRPVLPPPGGRPLPPVPGQKSNLSGEDHSNGQAIHQTKPQSTADSRSNKAKGSVRKRPEITILSARPMSEVGFRDGKMDHSPVSTPSPIIVEHLGGDGTAGGHLPPDQPHPVPARPKSPLPSRPKSPVPSHPKMPIPSRPKSFVSNENTKGVESGQSSVEEKPRVKIEVTEEQRPKRPTIIRAAPKPPSIDSVSNQLQVSSNSTEAGLISSVVVPKPRPRPRSMKISSDPDMKPEAFEQFDSDDEESLAESKRSPKEAPPPRPLPSPKMLQKKDLNAQDSKLSPRSEQPPPRPPPSPKLSIRRKDTNSKHSPGSEETGNETSKMAEPPPRPPPSPKMSMRRKPEDSTSDGSSNASKPKPKPKPKPVVLPKPKLAVKPVMSQKKEIVEDDTNQLCEWDIIEDNAIKPARAPPKPPRTKSFDSQMSDDASPLSSDITPSPRNEDNRLANKDSNEDNRSNRPRPPLPKRRSIATAQSSEGDPSEKLRENETRQREVIEQPCLTNKSADTVSEHIRRSSLAPHKERPPLPKRHSLDVSSMSTNKPKPNLLKSNSIVDDEFLPSDDSKSEDSTRKLPGAKQVLPTNITCDIQRAVNSHKEGMRKSDQTSEKPSSKWKQIVVNMNEEKRRAPPLPKRKNPPKCDSFIEKDADSKLSPETMPHSINFNEQPSDRDSVTDSLNESNKSSQSLSKPVAPVSRPPLPSKAPSKKKSDNPVQSSTDGGNIHSRDENSVQPLVQISPEGESKSIDRKEFILVKHADMNVSHLPENLESEKYDDSETSSSILENPSGLAESISETHDLEPHIDKAIKPNNSPVTDHYQLCMEGADPNTPSLLSDFNNSMPVSNMNIKNLPHSSANLLTYPFEECSTSEKMASSFDKEILHSNNEKEDLIPLLSISSQTNSEEPVGISEMTDSTHLSSLPVSDSESSLQSDISLDLDDFDGIDQSEKGQDDILFELEESNRSNGIFSGTTNSLGTEKAIPDILMTSVDGTVSENIFRHEEMSFLITNDRCSLSDGTLSASEHSFSSDDTLVPEQLSFTSEQPNTTFLTDCSDSESSNLDDQEFEIVTNVVEIPTVPPVPKRCSSLSSESTSPAEEFPATRESSNLDYDEYSVELPKDAENVDRTAYLNREFQKQMNTEEYSGGAAQERNSLEDWDICCENTVKSLPPVPKRRSSLSNNKSVVDGDVKLKNLVDSEDDQAICKFAQPDNIEVCASGSRYFPVTSELPCGQSEILSSSDKGQLIAEEIVKNVPVRPPPPKIFRSSLNQVPSENEQVCGFEGASDFDDGVTLQEMSVTDRAQTIETSVSENARIDNENIPKEQDNEKAIVGISCSSPDLFFPSKAQSAQIENLQDLNYNTISVKFPPKRPPLPKQSSLESGVKPDMDEQRLTELKNLIQLELANNDLSTEENESGAEEIQNSLYGLYTIEEVQSSQDSLDNQRDLSTFLDSEDQTAMVHAENFGSIELIPRYSQCFNPVVPEEITDGAGVKTNQTQLSESSNEMVQEFLPNGNFDNFDNSKKQDINRALNGNADAQEFDIVPCPDIGKNSLTVAKQLLSSSDRMRCSIDSNKVVYIDHKKPGYDSMSTLYSGQDFYCDPYISASLYNGNYSSFPIELNNNFGNNKDYRPALRKQKLLYMDSLDLDDEFYSLPKRVEIGDKVQLKRLRSINDYQYQPRLQRSAKIDETDIQVFLETTNAVLSDDSVLLSNTQNDSNVCQPQVDSSLSEKTGGLIQQDKSTQSSSSPRHIEDNTPPTGLEVLSNSSQSFSDLKTQLLRLNQTPSVENNKRMGLKSDSSMSFDEIQYESLESKQSFDDDDDYQIHQGQLAIAISHCDETKPLLESCDQVSMDENQTNNIQGCLMTQMPTNQHADSSSFSPGAGNQSDDIEFCTMSEIQSPSQKTDRRLDLRSDSCMSFDEIHYQPLKSTSFDGDSQSHPRQLAIEVSASCNDTKPLLKSFDGCSMDEHQSMGIQDGFLTHLAISPRSDNNLQSPSVVNPIKGEPFNSDIKTDTEHGMISESTAKQKNHIFLAEPASPHSQATIGTSGEIQETSDLQANISVREEITTAKDLPFTLRKKQSTVGDSDGNGSPKRQKPPLPSKAPSPLPSSPEGILLVRRRSSRKLRYPPKQRSFSTGDVELPLRLPASTEQETVHVERSLVNQPTGHSPTSTVEQRELKNQPPPRPRLPRALSFRSSLGRLAESRVTSMRGTDDREPISSRSSSVPIISPQVSGGFGDTDMLGEKQNTVKSPQKGSPKPIPRRSSDEEKVSLRSKPNRPTGGPSRPMSMPLKSLNTGKLSGSEEKRVKGDKPHPPQPQHSKADSLGAPVLPQRPGPGHPLYHYLVEGPRGVALFDYGSDQPDELTFKSGDTILLLRRIDHAWLMGKIGKKQGIFPQNFIDILEPLPDADEQMPSEDIVGSHSPVVKQDLFGHGPRCQARFDFDSDGADDLTFEEGDVIRIIDHIGEDWLKGEFSGKTGIFPLSFVEIIEDLPFEAVQQKTDQTVTHNNNINVVSAVSDFEGHENELTFQKGAKITVLSQVGKEWLFGELNGQQGLFPSNFVDSVPPGLPEYQLPETETQSPTAVTDSPHCIALFDYLGQTQEDLQFETGQKIELLEHVGTDWLRGRINDREGMFPSSFVQIERDVIPEQKAVKFGRALFDFLGQNESELTFKAGAMICLQELLDGDGNWRWGELDGRRGIFPSNFVEEQ